MLNILLAEGLRTQIDDADLLLISGFAWRPLKPKPEYDIWYAGAWNGKQHFLMHRLILGAGDNETVDHADGDGLNNQRFNLRIASRKQQQANRGRQRNNRSSQYKGVFWDKSRNRWAASIHADRKTRALGRYLSEDDAARAYDKAAVKEFGNFARLNFPVDNGTLCALHTLKIKDAPCVC